jgi:ribosomal protein S12 methylthiotransferase
VLDRIVPGAAKCPDLAIRSTFITGFPGETEAEFNELLDFLDEAQLDRVGAFAYSPVEGASANDLPGRAARRGCAKSARHAPDAPPGGHQHPAPRAHDRARIRVLVDDIDEEGAIARSQGDAPDVDGLVYIADGETWRSANLPR